MTEPKPGDFLVTATYGDFIERTVGWLIRYGTDADVNHAALYVGNDTIIEARPNGAGFARWDQYEGARWSTGSEVSNNLTDKQRDDVVKFGNALAGYPYGWLDIFAITLAQRRLHSILDVHKAMADQPWWVRQVESWQTLICSQLVDLAYLQAGVHLFNDGRLPGLVSPGDLAGLL